MSVKLNACVLTAVLCLTLYAPLLAQSQSSPSTTINHVLLISVDGLHALDVARYVSDHPNSALAQLSQQGVTYTNARTPANSDSFPVCWPWSRAVRPSHTDCFTTSAMTAPCSIQPTLPAPAERVT